MTTKETHRIEAVGDRCYTLYVGESPSVVIEWQYGVRVCRWQVYGPVPLEHAMCLMEGFLHLAALIGQEERVVETSLEELSGKKRRRK